MAWISAPAEWVEPGVLNAPPDHLSFSSLGNLVPDLIGNEFGCPRKFAYGKLLGLPFEGGPMLHVGSVVDRAITALLERRIAGETKEAEAAAATAAFDAEVGERPAMTPPYVTVATEAMALVLRHLHEAAPVVSVQQRLDFTVRVDGGAQRIEGYLDWLDIDGVVNDLKVVGSTRFREPGWLAEKRMQLTGYWMGRTAAARRGIALGAPLTNRGRLVIAYHSTKLKAPQLHLIDVELTEADRERYVEAVRRGDAVVRSGRYPARPGQACGLCDYAARCRDDHARSEPPFSVVTGVPAALAGAA